MGQFSLSPRRLTSACVAICRRHVNTDSAWLRMVCDRSKYILRLTAMTAGRPVIGACSRPSLVPIRVRQAISGRRADVHRHPRRMRDFVSFGRICSFRPVPSRNICSAAG
jgi:hypothetical protein